MEAQQRDREEAATRNQEEGEAYRPAAIFDSVTTWRTVGPGKRVDVPADLSALR